MAALLRSARLLKTSPCPLLLLKGVHRQAAAGSGVYSRALCRRLAGPSGALSSLFPYSSASACSALRYYSTASKQEGEPNFTGHKKQTEKFDWTLSRLDNSVRRTGRVTKTLLLRLFNDICETGCPSGSQALLLLRSCGSLLPELRFSERTELVHQFWEELEKQGVTFDISHYNSLLKVYLQNEFNFSPIEFLAKMEAANLQPNRVTYQRLVAAYCQNGDIEGASKVLAIMKSEDLPITETVFNSLVMGHARAGDMESATNILSVMKGAGLEPGLDTYVVLLRAYAEKGDIVKIQETLSTLRNTNNSLIDKDLLQIILSLARSGHEQHVPKITKHLKYSRGYVADFMNVCFSLITLGFEDTAFALLNESENGDGFDKGNFFLRHCVNMDLSPEKLLSFCITLKESNQHSAPHQFILHCALDAKKTDLAIAFMKLMKKDGFPIRPHYFWPLLTSLQKDNNTAGILQIIKAMQDLDVVPDIETYLIYVLPTFPSLDSAQAALKDAGCEVESYRFFSAAVRFLATTKKFSELFTLMSEPSFPVINMSAFRGSLISGFKTFSDVESMAKITELLFKDNRFNQGEQKEIDDVAYFLYNLLDSMSEAQVQAKEQKLREYLKELKNRDIVIPLKIYKGIVKLLNSYHMPELTKDFFVLMKTEDFRPTDISSKKTPEGKVAVLEMILEKLTSQEKPVDRIFRQLLSQLCSEEIANLTRALELKTRFEEQMTPHCYSMIINLCCRLDKTDEAINLKRELAGKHSDYALDGNNYIMLVKVLTKHNMLDEAIDILKEMKEKDVAVKDTTEKLLIHTLNAAALKGDHNTVRSLQEAIFSLGLVKPSNRLCFPLVKSYLERGDMLGALEAAVECLSLYSILPRIHEIVCGLIEKEDTELLQKAMDLLIQKRGEMTMVFELFFGFMQMGRFREARRIIETPGLRAKPGKFQWFAEKCIAHQQVEILENMVEITSKLFDCDRDEMYHYLLRLYKDINDWHKARAVWMKMQEENVVPRERTLRLLADILRSNNQEVPFDVPMVWFEQTEDQENDSIVEDPMSSEPKTVVKTPEKYERDIQKLIKNGKTKKAFHILKKAEQMNIAMDMGLYDELIRALLGTGNLKESVVVKDIAVKHKPEFIQTKQANNLQIITLVSRGKLKDALTVLKDMVQAKQMPSNLAVVKMVKRLGRQGDVQGIQDVENVVKMMGKPLTLSQMVFVNNTALAHIKNGNSDHAVELLESIYTQDPDASNKSCYYVFQNVLKHNNKKALEKLSAMVERLCNQFALYRPVTDLFLVYIGMGKVEEAKFLLQRCEAISEQKVTLRTYMANISKEPGQVANLKMLQEFFPDLVEKEEFCYYLMKCYTTDNDLTSAKALYQQMLADGLQMNEVFLKKLALELRVAGENVPFEEPPENFSFYVSKLRESKTQSSEHD